MKQIVLCDGATLWLCGIATRDDFSSRGSTEMKHPLKHSFCSLPPRNQDMFPLPWLLFALVGRGALGQQIEERILTCWVLVCFNLTQQYCQCLISLSHTFSDLYIVCSVICL